MSNISGFVSGVLKRPQAFQGLNPKPIIIQQKQVEEEKPSLKKVIFTCITNGYDTLKDPDVITEGYDYICFTDNLDLKVKVWKLRPIPQELITIDKTKQQRNIKICPHKYLSEYDMSVWVDGNIKLDFNIENFIKKFIDDKHNVFVKRHPQRTCIYQEMTACLNMKKDTAENMKPQIDGYKKEGYPAKCGLAETNFIVRNHNSEDCKKLMECWVNEVNNGSKRDQLSFNYAVWKTKVSVKYFEPVQKLRPKGHPNVSKIETIKGKKTIISNTYGHINFCIVNYNTSHMIDCLIKSIHKTTPNSHIYIFDNSDSEEVYKTTFKDVTVFDNTKGQYIDFEVFLNKYKDRAKSAGRTNKHGSAKHCISVEKCMNLIKENFILLDSDILIKRDVTELFDPSVMYVGETIFQPNSKIKRILPFINFINVDTCLKYNIHYFDDNYMHGLRKTPKADMYDTGGGFYIHAKDYSHQDIKCEDYIVHYNGGSWAEEKSKKLGRTQTSDEWLNENKKYWED